ncbi:hypothetical protein DV737_g4951, partial [Chaetothyriales sp. CBS 132003]
MFRPTASRALPRTLRSQTIAKSSANGTSKLLRAHLQTYANQRASAGLLSVAVREPLKRSLVQYRSITSYQSPSFVKGRNVEEEAEIGRAKLEATPEQVSLSSTTSGAITEVDSHKAASDEDVDMTGGIRSDFKTIVDTFSLKDVPKEALVVGLAGVLPYLGTSLTTVYLSWDIQYAAHHGHGVILSADTAEKLLHLIEPIELGYGASIISFLGAIHWGLEWAGYGGNQGYSRYAIGIIATAVAWPTLLLPAEVGLITQFLAFTFLYYADARAATRGWAPPWYATYRFVLTFVSQHMRSERQSPVRPSPSGNKPRNQVGGCDTTHAAAAHDQHGQDSCSRLQADAKKTFIGSVDNGTTSSRFLIFDANGEPVAQHQIEFKQIYPHSGWHEHDPAELISSVSECIDKATEAFQQLGHQISDIQAIGITNQRETTVVWDKATGEPLHNAVVWTDTRSASLVRELKLKDGADELAAICGEQLTTYPSVAKLLWLLHNVDAVKKAYEAGNLAFGTVDTWLVYKLNGGNAANVFVTDPSNAGRTMFMNIRDLTYDKKLLDFFGLDTSKIALPKIVPSAHATAYGKLASTVLKGVRITGCLGDQSAALVGQGGFVQGRAKNTYGTGAFLLLNVGAKPVISSHGLMSTVAFDFSPQGVPPAYALEGSIAVAGSSVKFLMNNLGFFRDSHHISELARTVPDNGGTVFVTAFSGARGSLLPDKQLFAPYWIDSAKGTLFGLTAHTQRGHIARATLEATCFQTRAILDAMQADSQVTLTDLAVDGGMSNSELCMQTQADMIQIPVDRPQMRETTALGAAIAAGFAVGVWKSLDELKNINQEGRTIFRPQMDKRRSEAMYRKWQKAVKMSEGWTDDDDEVLHHEKL